MTITEFILSARAGLRSLYAQSHCVFKQMRRLRLREAVKSSSPHSDRSKNGSLILSLSLKYMLLTYVSYIWSAVYTFHSSIQQPRPWNALFFTSSCPWKALTHPLRLSSPVVSSLRSPHFLHTWWITSPLCCMAGGTLYPAWLCGVGFPTGLKVPVSWAAGAGAYSSLSLSTTNNAQKMLVLNGFISSFIHSSIHSFKKPKKE